ncbi:hypothetical protein [Rhodococcus sp. WB9]|uniref:hypothetical protein n=1 Tax=Rhodococcus sp. WB9 TaxID=2594007 RepID=UPI00164234E0
MAGTHAGGDPGDQTGDQMTDRRLVVPVADPSSDDGADHRPHAGSRGNDAGRVGVGVEVRDSLVDLLDLTGQEQCLFGFVGDVLSELDEVHPVRPVAGAHRARVSRAAVMSPAA